MIIGSDVIYQSAQAAEDMFQAVTERSEWADIIIKAAAVADYRPATVSSEKIKKSDDQMSIGLERTQDILGYLGAHKRDGHQGFHPSYESPRFLLASACQRTETIRVRQRIFTSVSFSTDSQCRINYCYTCGLINAGAT